MISESPLGTADRPGLIWGLDFNGGETHPVTDIDLLTGRPWAGGFRWLHLNLADQWTRAWIETAERMPRAMRSMLLDPERHQRALVEDGWVGCVLHDMERDFDRLEDFGSVGQLMALLKSGEPRASSGANSGAMAAAE